MSRRQNRDANRQSRTPGARDYEAPGGRLRALQPLGLPKILSDQPADPLAAAIRHNSRSCPLLSLLPEELLVEIMSRLDEVSIFCLRRTSRVFLRLFGSQAFEHLHDNEGFFEPGPWPAQKLPQGEHWLRMSLLLRRDAYCVDCGARCDSASTLQVRYMHCSGCGRDHPVTLFSAAQRRTPRSKRVCIGLEGHVRLCEHKTVSVRHVGRYAGLVRRFSCRHPSHVPGHHGSLGPKEGAIFPTLEFGPGDKKGHATISHTAHLDLSGYGLAPVTAGDFRGHMRELRKGPAGLIIREHAPGILPELRCFDPGRCGCLAYPGLAAYEGDCAPHEASTRVFSRAGGGGGGVNATSVKFETCELGTRCLKVTHARTVHFRTGAGRAELERQDGDAAPERARGAACGKGWRVSRALDAVAGRVSYNWYPALDPDSHRLTHDRLMCGVTWCGSRGCANYHGYLRERAVRGQRINAACRDGCGKKSASRRDGKHGLQRERRGGIRGAARNGGSFELSCQALWVEEEWCPGLASGPGRQKSSVCTIL